MDFAQLIVVLSSIAGIAIAVGTAFAYLRAHPQGGRRILFVTSGAVIIILLAAFAVEHFIPINSASGAWVGRGTQVLNSSTGPQPFAFFVNLTEDASNNITGNSLACNPTFTASATVTGRNDNGNVALQLVDTSGNTLSYQGHLSGDELSIEFVTGHTVKGQPFQVTISVILHHGSQDDYSRLCSQL